MFDSVNRWLSSRKIQQAYYCVQSGQIEAAEQLCAAIIAAEPDNAHAHHVLGLAAIRRGDGGRAIEQITRAIGSDPSQPDFHISLGMACYGAGRLPEAVGHFRRALDLRPEHPVALNNLGICYKDQGEYSEAADCFRKAIALSPEQFAAYMNLGNTLTVQNDIESAVVSLRKAISIQPNLAAAWSNPLFVQNYRSDSSPEELYRESVQFDRQYAAPLLPDPLVFTNTPDPQKVLRVGYVSPDFREHSVAHFTSRLLGAHRRDRVAVYCYADVGRPDERTRQLQAGADQWRTIAGMADGDVAAAIRDDGIDILVDLAGHTASNRLLVFARKPAPVQVAWLGYPNTTGMRAMDYRLTDAIADPPGETDRLHTEKLVRLDHGFLCYQSDEPLPEPAPAPCLQQGQVTFGSFNSLPKVAPEVVLAWSEILQRVPGARLLLKSMALADALTRVRLLKSFRDQGIDTNRLELVGWLPGRAAHLELYSRVDVGLDPFPYNGATTTCEALWMGVPVITLRGERHAGRVGASILERVGLPELIAGNREQYVHLATSLAGDWERLAALRGTLRSRLQQSELMNLPAFTASLEQAYRTLWTAWCRQRGPQTAPP